MLRGMSWGFLSFIILFPAGIFIWAAGEKRRRDAMPPEELKELEADEDYGPIDPKLECIFCHSKNCVRTQSLGSLSDIMSEDRLEAAANYRFCGPFAGLPLAEKPSSQTLKAHCMNCGNDWEFYLPEADEN